MLNPTAAKLAGSLPFKTDAIETLECKTDASGDLNCQVGLTGAASKTALKIRGTDIKNVQCHRENGVLVCEVETPNAPNGKERVIF
jgi:hypothetical protein